MGSKKLSVTKSKSIDMTASKKSKIRISEHHEKRSSRLFDHEGARIELREQVLRDMELAAAKSKKKS